MKVRTLVLTLLLIGVTTLCFSANRYAVASGSWSDTSTWSAISGGLPGASVPSSADDVFIGEGAGSFTVNVPPGNNSSGRVYIGSSAGNSTSGGLTFSDPNSKLTVSGTVYIYRSQAANERFINVGPGTLTVNNQIFLGEVAPGSNASSVSSLNINGGTVTTGNLNFGAAAGLPLQSQVNFVGSGLMNIKGNLNLVNGAGTFQPGTGTVDFAGSAHQTIDGDSDITFYNLNVNNLSGIHLNGLVVVDGTWTQAAGEITGTPPNVDGYTSSNYNFIDINPDDNLMIGFMINVTTPALYPAYIDRQWELHGDYVGTKTVTFYWDDIDDHNYNWTGKTVAVWHDGISTIGSSNTDDMPRYTQVFLEAPTGSHMYNIGLHPPQTLPVELSSFTAVITPQNYVKLDWITQSETGVLGYYVFRNTENNLSNAIQVCPLISANNTSQVQIYSFIDNDVEPGLYYYWLQNVDFD
ncbi:MAG: hypothetical protein U1C33_00345, partial [Candidatus Cloacimonadaceae bacterium]|nr:hypothetical protein [Candidatus Cloacimonadaceae bacterium]